MPRRAFVPSQLREGPFTLEYALSVGLTRDQLRGSSWRSVGRGVYSWRGHPETPRLLLQAALLRLPFDAVFARTTAGWIHGLGTPPASPIEVTVNTNSAVSSRVGVAVRRAKLRVSELTDVDGLPVTTAARTLFDLATTLELVDAVVATDTALRTAVITADELRAAVAEREGAAGLNRFRRVVEHAEPKSESPMETRLRMLLVLAGLPRPQAQVALRGDRGDVLGRVDLFYSGAGVAIEYDGATHRDSWVEDNRRQNLILGAGYRLLRFTAADMRTPAQVVAAVRSMLAAAA